MTTHCTNESCQERTKCKKGQSMRDGQNMEFLHPKTVFDDCESFECLACHFTHVHGEDEKQCRKCGAYQQDSFVFACPWELTPDARNA